MPASSPPGPLTRKQARAEYIRLVGPYNVAADQASRDYTDAAPWSVG